MKLRLILVGLGLAMPLLAEPPATPPGFLANAKEVFRPLIADPHEPQIGLKMTAPVGHRNLGDIALGGYFGLYRWALPWTESYLQWSIAGGVFSRFDLVSEQKDNQVLDYLAQMPLDASYKSWSLRFMPFHISSHLGDDYIKRTGRLPEKYAFDSLKMLVSWQADRHWRLYAGPQYLLRNTNVTLRRYAFQGGMEWTSSWMASGHAQLFMASDVQAWQRVGYNPQLVAQAGIRLARHAEDKKMLSVYTEYATGHIVYGQLFDQKESHWSLGLRFYLP